jgi:hypothetical protein
LGDGGITIDNLTASGKISSSDSWKADGSSDDTFFIRQSNSDGTYNGTRCSRRLSWTERVKSKGRRRRAHARRKSGDKCHVHHPLLGDGANRSMHR